jgi:hypothetical protein
LDPREKHVFHFDIKGKSAKQKILDKARSNLPTESLMKLGLLEAELIFFHIAHYLFKFKLLIGARCNAWTRPAIQILVMLQELSHD